VTTAMSDGGGRIRSTLVIIFPMFIATLSLGTSIYNGYLNNKFVAIIQGNLGKAEYMRTCKEIIDAYFQVKFRAGLLADAGVKGATSPTQQSDAANAVSHFGALGTYLANLRDEATRVRYTDLSRQLDKIVKDAGHTSPEQLDKLFEPADTLFAAMNDDCVKAATAAPL
jgi:hypothetical protein